MSCETKENPNLNKGFTIENPPVFVPWEITISKFKKLLKNANLKQINENYFLLPCTSLGGIKHILGFQFSSDKKSVLTQLDFIRKDKKSTKESYRQFQTSIEKFFGKPTSTARGRKGLDAHHWDFGKVEIIHSVIDRFGREEHLKIRYWEWIQ